MPPRGVQRTHVHWILACRTSQQFLGLLDTLELVQVEGLADFDADLERGIVRYPVVGGDRRIIALGGLVGIGKRGQSEGKVGP